MRVSPIARLHVGRVFRLGWRKHEEPRSGQASGDSEQISSGEQDKRLSPTTSPKCTGAATCHLTWIGRLGSGPVLEVGEVDEAV